MTINGPMVVLPSSKTSIGCHVQLLVAHGDALKSLDLLKGLGKHIPEEEVNPYGK